MKRSTKPIVDEIVETAKKPKKEKKKTPRIPSGSDLLDLITGGGFPKGKIVNIVGDNSTGKTFLAIDCIASARKAYGPKLKWRYNDAESGFSFDTEKICGFDIMEGQKKMIKELGLSPRSDTIEEFSLDLDKCLDTLKEDELLIYVVDSLDALSSEAERDYLEKKLKAQEEGKESKGTYGLEKQKYLGQFFRTMAGKIEDKSCLLIIISQVRENISTFAFSSKYKRMGGKALDFYASFILWLSEVEKHKKKGRAYSVTIRAYAKKAKTERPFRDCLLDIVFAYGIDNIMSNINFLYDLKTDTGKEKKKQKVEWDGKDYTVPGLISFIEDNNLESELTERVVEKWEEIEASVSTERKPKY